MENESGIVVAVENGRAVIQMTPGSYCQKCAAKDICSSLGETTRQISVPTTKKLSVGERVTLSYRASSRVTSAMIVFILPILFLIAGYFFGTSFFGKSEGWGILGSLLGLVVGFVAIWLLNKILERKQSFIPQILQEHHANH